MEKQKINYKKIYDGISDKNLRYEFVKNYIINNKYFEIQNTYFLMEDRFTNWENNLDIQFLNDQNLKTAFIYYVTKNKQDLDDSFFEKCTNEKLYNLYLVCIFFEHLSLFEKIMNLNRIPNLILYFGLLVNEKNNKEITKKIIDKIDKRCETENNKNLLENFIQNERIYLYFFEFAPELLQKVNYSPTKKNISLNFLTEILNYDNYIQYGNCEDLVFQEFEKLADKCIKEKEQKIEELEKVITEKNNQINETESIYEKYYLDKITEKKQKIEELEKVITEKNNQINETENIYEKYYLDKITEIESKHNEKIIELNNIILTKDEDIEFLYKKNENKDNIIDENNKKYQNELNNIRIIFNDIIAEKDAISTELLSTLKKTLKLLGEREQELDKMKKTTVHFNIEDYIEKDTRKNNKNDGSISGVVGNVVGGVVEKILNIV